MTHSRDLLLIINILPGRHADELLDKLINRPYDCPDKDRAYRFDESAIKTIQNNFFKEDSKKDKCICLAALWNKSKDDIDRIYISRGILTNRNNPRLLVDNTTEIKESDILEELNKFLFLSAQTDERGKGFVRIETSEAFVRKVSFYLTPAKYKVANHETVMPSTEIAPYFQTNEDSLRQYPENDLNSRSALGPFELDYERIVRSKSFRRLVDKAQVFSARKGDHYRTRMTHTQEVARIARRLAKALGANELLTETIALAHDIGHTPFGHQGERTLADCLMDLARTDGIPETCSSLNVDGGFKHTLQAVRVLTQLERVAPNHEGLNLSWQVVEGALWHTRVPLRMDCNECARAKKNQTCCNPMFFIARRNLQAGKEFVQRVFHKGPYKAVKTCSLTLEGQIVALADEIAQRGHDIDDALSAGLLSAQDLVDILFMKFSSRLAEVVVHEIEALADWNQRDDGVMANPNALMRERLVLAITNYFIDDAVKETLRRSEQEWIDAWDGIHRVFTSRAVWLSKNGELLCDYLAAVVNNRVLTSRDVSGFDGQAHRIIRALFYSYFENPRLLPVTTLKRFSLVERHNIAVVAKRPDLVFDLTNCTAKGMDKEIEEIKKTRIRLANTSDHKTVVEEVYQSKKLLLARVVTDYIAGMTDSYALEQYSEIVGDAK